MLQKHNCACAYLWNSLCDGVLSSEISFRNKLLGLIIYICKSLHLVRYACSKFFPYIVHPLNFNYIVIQCSSSVLVSSAHYGRTAILHMETAWSNFCPLQTKPYITLFTQSTSVVHFAQFTATSLLHFYWLVSLMVPTHINWSFMQLKWAWFGTSSGMACWLVFNGLFQWWQIQHVLWKLSASSSDSWGAGGPQSHDGIEARHWQWAAWVC